MDDENKVVVEMVWINEDLARYSVRVRMTPGQARSMAEKLQSAAKGE